MQSSLSLFSGEVTAFAFTCHDTGHILTESEYLGGSRQYSSTSIRARPTKSLRTSACDLIHLRVVTGLSYLEFWILCASTHVCHHPDLPSGVPLKEVFGAGPPTSSTSESALCQPSKAVVGMRAHQSVSWSEGLEDRGTRNARAQQRSEAPGNPTAETSLHPTSSESQIFRPRPTFSGIGDGRTFDITSREVTGDVNSSWSQDLAYPWNRNTQTPDQDPSQIPIRRNVHSAMGFEILSRSEHDVMQPTTVDGMPLLVRDLFDSQAEITILLEILHSESAPVLAEDCAQRVVQRTHDQALVGSNKSVDDRNKRNAVNIALDKEVSRRDVLRNLCIVGGLDIDLENYTHEELGQEWQERCKEQDTQSTAIRSGTLASHLGTREDWQLSNSQAAGLSKASPGLGLSAGTIWAPSTEDAIKTDARAGYDQERGTDETGLRHGGKSKSADDIDLKSPSRKNASIASLGNSRGDTLRTSQSEPVVKRLATHEMGYRALELPNMASVSMGRQYQVESPAYFQIGVVFETQWIEPAGQDVLDSLKAFQVIPGNFVAKRRKFIIVEHRHDHCAALAINTYCRQGVGKSATKKSEHAIAYTGSEPPIPSEAENPAPGERGMRPRAIRVVTADRVDKLHPMSRLNLGKVRPFEFHTKLRHFGVVHSDSLHDLLSQHEQVNEEYRKARHQFYDG